MCFASSIRVLKKIDHNLSDTHLRISLAPWFSNQLAAFCRLKFEQLPTLTDLYQHHPSGPIPFQYYTLLLKTQSQCVTRLPMKNKKKQTERKKKSTCVCISSVFINQITQICKKKIIILNFIILLSVQHTLLLGVWDNWVVGEFKIKQKQMDCF